MTRCWRSAFILVEADGIMLSTRDRAIVRQVLVPFAARIDRVAVFGSRAMGTARPASDIDLVLWGELDDAVLARLGSRFLDSGLAVTVDAVRYGPDLPPAFRRHLDSVARPLFDRQDLLANDAAAGPRP